MHRVNTHNEGNSVTLYNQSHTVNSKHIHAPTKLKSFKSFLPTKPPMNTRTSMTWCQQEWPSLTVNWWWSWQWGEQNRVETVILLFSPPDRTNIRSNDTWYKHRINIHMVWLSSVNSTIWDSNTPWKANEVGLTPRLHQTPGLVKLFLYSFQTIISGAKLSQKIQSL